MYLSKMVKKTSNFFKNERIFTGFERFLVFFFGFLTVFEGIHARMIETLNTDCAGCAD